jgi:hypothetical protein
MKFIKFNFPEPIVVFLCTFHMIFIRFFPCTFTKQAKLALREHRLEDSSLCQPLTEISGEVLEGRSSWIKVDPDTPPRCGS